MTITVHESGYRQGTRAVVPEGNGQKILVRLMGWEPGTKTVEGSSADYPVEVIARDFGEAFPVGTRMRANHDGFCEAGGDIRRIFAKTVTAPERREDGMYAWARVREGEPTEIVRQYADVIGTSISAGADIEREAAEDEDGEPILDSQGKPIMVPVLSERGAQIVKRFLSMNESPYNSVDFVEAPGADGAIVELVTESIRKNVLEHTTIREAASFSLDLAGKRETTKTSEAAPPRITQKEKQMEAEEAQTIAENAATAAVKAYVESQAPTASEQPTLGVIAEAVVTAGLTEAGRKAVYERVDRGEAVEAAIESEKEREDAMRAEFQRESEGRRSSESAFGSFGYTDDTEGKPLSTEKSGGEAREGINAAFDAAFEEEMV